MKALMVGYKGQRISIPFRISRLPQEDEVPVSLCIWENGRSLILIR